MNKILKSGLIALLVVAAVSITAVSVAYAQTDDPPRPHELLADLLGVSEGELWDLMHSGQSLEDLAEEAGVDLEAFWQEMQAAREEYHKQRLQEALDNGDITREQYDWMLEGFENGLMGGFHRQGQPGDGFRPRPFGGGGGFGGQGRPGFGCGMDRFDS